METLAEYVATIPDAQHRTKFLTLCQWVSETFPELQLRFGWRQPMFTHHGTFILGLKQTKKYITISPEVAAMKQFTAQLDAIGYAHTDNTFRIGWQEIVDYELLKAIIQFNMEDKANCTTFWRAKPSEA